MENQKIKEYIKQILIEAPFLTLATCVNNKPWTCAMIFVWDIDFNIYWLSRSDSRHSLEIEENPNVSINISMVEKDGKGRSLQIEGKVEIIEDKSRRYEADLNYHTRHQMVGFLTMEEAVEETKKHKLYKFTPSIILLSHEVIYGKERKEYIPL